LNESNESKKGKRIEQIREIGKWNQKRNKWKGEKGRDK